MSRPEVPDRAGNPCHWARSPGRSLSPSGSPTTGQRVRDNASPQWRAEQFALELHGGAASDSEDAAVADHWGDGVPVMTPREDGAPKALVLRPLGAMASSGRQPQLEGEQHMMPSHASQPQDAVTAVDTVPASEAWTEDMAAMIANVWYRAGEKFHSWCVTLPMDPALLRNTELHMNLTPHWLSLRFATDDAEAVATVQQHQAPLMRLLEEATGLHHQIGIEVG